MLFYLNQWMQRSDGDFATAASHFSNRVAICFSGTPTVAAAVQHNTSPKKTQRPAPMSHGTAEKKAGEAEKTVKQMRR